MKQSQPSSLSNTRTHHTTKQYRRPDPPASNENIENHIDDTNNIDNSWSLLEVSNATSTELLSSSSSLPMNEQPPWRQYGHARRKWLLDNGIIQPHLYAHNVTRILVHVPTEVN